MPNVLRATETSSSSPHPILAAGGKEANAPRGTEIGELSPEEIERDPEKTAL